MLHLHTNREAFKEKIFPQQKKNSYTLISALDESLKEQQFIVLISVWFSVHSNTANIPRPVAMISRLLVSKRLFSDNWVCQKKKIQLELVTLEYLYVQKALHFSQFWIVCDSWRNAYKTPSTMWPHLQ